MPFKSPVKWMLLGEHLPEQQQVIPNWTSRVCFSMMQSTCTHPKIFTFILLFSVADWHIDWFCGCHCNRNHHNVTTYSSVDFFLWHSFFSVDLSKAKPTNWIVNTWTIKKQVHVYTVLSYVSQPKIQKVISLKTKVKFYCEVKNIHIQICIEKSLRIK